MVNKQGNEDRSDESKDVDGDGVAIVPQTSPKTHEIQVALKAPKVVLALNAFQRNDLVLDKVGNAHASRVHTMFEHPVNVAKANTVSYCSCSKYQYCGYENMAPHFDLNAFILS